MKVFYVVFFHFFIIPENILCLHTISFNHVLIFQIVIFKYIDDKDIFQKVFCNIFYLTKLEVRLMSFCPSFPAFFDLLISLGQYRLIILLLKGGPNLAPHTLMPYSPMKLIEFSFEPITSCNLDICSCLILKPLMRPRVLAASMDLFCFYRGKLIPERYAFCDL